jgi:hypothetical protein
MADQPKDWISLAASLCALVASTISVILTHRNSRRLLEETERLKRATERAGMTYVIADEHLRKQVEALDAFIRVIQELKEQITLVTTSDGTSCTAASAIDGIERAKDLLVATFAQHRPDFSKKVLDQCHDTKGMAIVVEQQVRLGLHNAQWASEMPPEITEKLKDQRQELTAAQMHVTGEKLELLVQRSRHIVV